MSVVLFVALFVAIGAGNALGAATFPEKPIMLIVPYGAGGGSGHVRPQEIRILKPISS